jgi:hypothetical protein
LHHATYQHQYLEDIGGCIHIIIHVIWIIFLQIGKVDLTLKRNLDFVLFKRAKESNRASELQNLDIVPQLFEVTTS